MYLCELLTPLYVFYINYLWILDSILFILKIIFKSLQNNKSNLSSYKYIEIIN